MSVHYLLLQMVSNCVTILLVQHCPVYIITQLLNVSRSTAAKALALEYLNIFHILQSILHVIQVGLGYLLMLVAMTYNGWLFLAVIFGAGIGYFIFAACRKRLSATKKFEEQNEHCT